MPGVFLDTTVLIDVLNGRPVTERVRQVRRSGEKVWTSAVNVEELIRGLRPRETRAAQRLLFALRTAPLGRAEGERAGTWRREARATGVTLSQPDCLVAAAAVGVGARLATGNPRHFPMEELEVEHWPAGA